MPDFEKEVQGVALYLELRKPNATCQILLTPDGFSVSEGLVPAQLFRRVITSGVTKRKWKPYTITIPKGLEHLATSPTPSTDLSVSDDTKMDLVAGRFRHLADFFKSLNANGYKLVKDTPLFIEVSKADLTSIRSGTLPPKVWTRVKASRTAAGFPETSVDDPIAIMRSY